MPIIRDITQANGSNRPGAAWGCPVAKILNADADTSGPLQLTPPH
ncbi:hypothetical protein [Streptomyces canus]